MVYLDLRIIRTSAVFHTLGIFFSLIDAFIKFISLTLPFLGSFFNTSVMISYPGAFFGVMFDFVSLVTSFRNFVC